MFEGFLCFASHFFGDRDSLLKRHATFYGFDNFDGHQSFVRAIRESSMDEHNCAALIGIIYRTFAPIVLAIAVDDP